MSVCPSVCLSACFASGNGVARDKRVGVVAGRWVGRRNVPNRIGSNRILRPFGNEEKNEWISSERFGFVSHYRSRWN